MLLDRLAPGPIRTSSRPSEAELLCVAPATAEFSGQGGQGMADDLLSTLYLAFDGPVVMAPAMNCHMWAKPAVQRNVKQLRADGAVLVDPEEGYLSCGMPGSGPHGRTGNHLSTSSPQELAKNGGILLKMRDVVASAYHATPPFRAFAHYPCPASSSPPVPRGSTSTRCAT